MSGSDDRVRAWLDHLEISDVLARFAQGLDTRDFELYRSVWTDEIHVDYSSWRPDEPPRHLRSDDWVARNRLTMLGLDRTQHALSNIRTVIEGDTAVATAYVIASHYLLTEEGGSTFVIHGYYRDRLVRTDEGWRICAVQLNVSWGSGNKWIMTTAKERAAARLAAAGQA